MKTMKPFSVALALLFTTAAVAQATFNVDPAATKMIWTGKKVTGQHHGTLNVSAGTVGWGQDGLTAANVTIDMTSLTNTDLDKDYAPRLENHLKSADFFNTEVFKTAQFKSTRVERIAGAEVGQPNYRVTGDLTIKGITKPVTFDVLAWQEKRGVRAAGTMTFDRTLYDVQYRSGKFFDALGDKMIEDMVPLTFDLMAK